MVKSNSLSSQYYMLYIDTQCTVHMCCVYTQCVVMVCVDLWGSVYVVSGLCTQRSNGKKNTKWERSVV